MRHEYKKINEYTNWISPTVPRAINANGVPSLRKISSFMVKRSFEGHQLSLCQQQWYGGMYKPRGQNSGHF